MCNKCKKFKALSCGFHSHTDQSLDGATKVEAKILRAKLLGRSADVVTDHGVMSALVPHWEAVAKLKKGKDPAIPETFQSIHGIEAYLIDPYRPIKKLKNGKIEHPYVHCTIHFKTAEAYQYFCRLTPKMEERAVVRFGERKPLMTLEELEAISGHIVLGSGCLVGAIAKNVTMGRSDWAAEMYLRLREIAGPGNFFVEIMPHVVDRNWQKPKRAENGTIINRGFFSPITPDGVKRDPNAIDPVPENDPCKGSIDIQRMVNLFTLNMAKEHNDPVVISLDEHYAEKSDKVVQDARLGNGREDWKFYSSYHMFTSEECADNLRQQIGATDKQIEEWIDNSYRFVELFKDYKMFTAKDRLLLPTSQMVYGIEEPTKRKLKDLIDKHGRMPSMDNPKYPIYKERLDYEISVMADNPEADFLPYVFVVEDACDYARKNDILSNTRGSGGGCLIAYLLSISITDPIKYNLPFERFLTLGRIKSGSLPDFDTDWDDRHVIYQYLVEKYGDSVALIATNLNMRLKMSILDVERSTLGHVRPETTVMCKKIKGADQGQTDKEWLFGKVNKDTGNFEPGFWENKEHPIAQQLRKYAKDNPMIWETVQKCLGVMKTRGIHAGGVVITPGPVSDYFPLVHTEKGYATAYDMKGVEAAGGVKYDFLGVSTLKALGIAMRSIKQMEGVDLKWEEFPHDTKVYEKILAKDQLASIFQLNTSTVRPVVAKVGPKSITDIATVTALMRPGAMDAPSPDPKDPEDVTAADYYIQCARGERKPYFIHKDLKPILGHTHGIPIFQEQTLQIFRDLAGYTYETAEVVRRGISKKVVAIMEEHTAILKQKCVASDWTAEQAQRLVDMIKASARYGFNQAHATSYAIVAYNGCYLKYHHPLHFWKGELTINAEKHDKLRACLSECRDLLLPIDAIKSDPHEWLIDDGKLRPPLVLIKGCGAGAAKWSDLLKKAIPSSWSDFLEYLKDNKASLTNQGLSVSVLTILVYSGALDSLIDSQDRGSIRKYFEMYQELCKVRGSKAKLPTKTKKDIIGLEEMHHNAHLSLWRNQVNPLAQFDLIGLCVNALTQMGFRRTMDNPGFLPWKASAKGRALPTYIMDRWGDLFASENNGYFVQFSKKRANLAIMGIVISAKVMPYGPNNEKERMVMKLFTGMDHTDDIVIWPNEDGKLPEMCRSEIKLGALIRAIIVPSRWNGRPTATVVKWLSISI